MKSYLQQKRERAALVNELVQTIASVGRQFFLYEKEGKKNIASMEVDDRGVIWWIDQYSEEKIYVAYHGRWRGFTNGGTLKEFVRYLAQFVRDGVPLSPHVTGLSNVNYWAYPSDAVSEVQQLGIKLGVFRDLG